MTDIIKLAREAGAATSRDIDQTRVLFLSVEMLERFAELVAAQEREKVAQFCEENQINHPISGNAYASPFAKEFGGKHEGMAYAAAIRARAKEQTP